MREYISQIYHRLRAKKLDNYLRQLVSKGLVLGEGVSVLEPFFFDPAHVYLISIGNRCTFAPGVRLIAHDASIKRALGFTKIGRITIGDDCFIGAGTIILSNVSIGHGSIIGAGSVVTRNIPSNSVAVGSPAQVISSATDYIEENRNLANETRVFDRSYHVSEITKKKVTEIREATTTGAAYII